MSNEAEESQGDAELAWQKQFVFDHHEIVGIYKRKFSFEIDTGPWEDFNTALVDETATAVLRKHSECVDNKRYGICLYLHHEPGYMAVYLQAVKGSIKQDPLPRVVSFKIDVLVPGSQKPVASKTCNYTYTEYNGFGYPQFVSLADIRACTAHETLAQKHLLIKVEVEEYLSSSKADFLPKPALEMARIISSLNHALSHSGDAVAGLSDGHTTIHTTLLKKRCKHFESVFSADFREGHPSIIQTVGSETASDATESLMDSGMEDSAPYDSDCDEEAIGKYEGSGKRQELKVVKLPNFSKATFDAFVLYLYTGSITFKPIKSSAVRISQLPNNVAMRSVLKGECSSSPKSMYAMADYFDVPALKELSKTALLAMIYPGNLLQELAQPFGRLHKPILQALEDYAVKNWSQITATSTFDDDVQIVMEYEESRKVFTNILKKASKK